MLNYLRFITLQLLTPAKIRFLGDPTAEFTEALELGFEARAIFGGVRGKRYALVIKDGKIAAVHVEPDNTGTSGQFSTSVAKIYLSPTCPFSLSSPSPLFAVADFSSYVQSLSPRTS